MSITRIPTRYVIVILTFICTSVCYIERVGFSIAYTVAADAEGVSQSSKGTILSTFYYGYALSQIPGGWAAQKIGGRRVLLLSFILWSLTCALVPLDPKKAITLVIARLLVGVAQGFIFPSIHTVLAQWVPPHERSRSVSLTTSGMYLGAAMGMLFLPTLVKFKGPQSVFLAEAGLGGMWSLLWWTYASDPPRSQNPKAAASGFGESLLPVKESQRTKNENISKIPWKRIFLSLPVWAIVANNFTFHYALYVLMNWLPTYFELGLKSSLQEMGSSKMVPYLNMFIFSNIGGVIADHFITKKIMSVTKTRKLLNTIGFAVSSLALVAIPYFRTPGGVVMCSSLALGFLALGRAGFAVNHMDIAPRYAGIVMGVSNTAGTLAGIIGVGLTGQILEAARLFYTPTRFRVPFCHRSRDGKMPAGHGLRSRTRDLFARGFRKKGTIHLSTYLRTYHVGDYVDVKVNGAVHKGMPHKFYHGRTGQVWNVTKRAIGVEMNKQVGNRIIKKRIHVRIEHVMPSRCTEEFKQRVKKNDVLKAEAKAKGVVISTKRQPLGPKPGFMVEGTTLETVTPIPYDVVNDLKGGY